MTAALAAPFSVRKGDDEVSTARERLDIDVVHGFLAASCWAAGIARFMEIFAPDVYAKPGG